MCSKSSEKCSKVGEVCSKLSVVFKALSEVWFNHLHIPVLCNLTLVVGLKSPGPHLGSVSPNFHAWPTIWECTSLHWQQ